MPSAVAIEAVSLFAADRPILRDVTLHIAPRESVALIGRSGAGKTTLLRLLNGLATPTSGVVSIDGIPVAPGRSNALAVRRRSIGTMLQAPALFPHRTIYDNVATVPRLLGWDEARIRTAARELLEQLELPFDRFAARFPRSLSGGEQQRVGIVRAMIAEPPLLLCDEPFSAVDPLVRRDLQESFIRLRDRGEVTMIFVTHDLAEALRVGKRIVLIDDGTIVCDEPRARFLASEHPLVRRYLDAARIPEAS
jgi:osmoprotectant transport system ATP-binding protein